MKNKLIIGLITVFIILIVWYGLAVGVSILRGVTFPTPRTTLIKLWTLFSGEPLSGHSIYKHTLQSLVRWMVAFVIAAAIGIQYGLVAGRHALFEQITMPIIHILQLIPGLAWIPVALLMFGIGERATLFMISITAFTPIALNVYTGIKCIDPVYIRTARMLGAGGYGLVFRVLLPATLPQLLNGLRIGLGNGWRVLLAAEMIVGTGTGLGYSIIQARWTLDYTSAFSCLVIICLLGLFVEHILFKQIERHTIERWGISRPS
jgi:ABC-type nitrate/sulfonate/bicarbonate transport system permease component